MKAKVKATGKVVEVKAWKGSSDVFFATMDMSHFYDANELEFMESEPVVFVSRLNQILKQATEIGYINEYGAHRILDLVKTDIIRESGNEDNFTSNQ